MSFIFRFAALLIFAQIFVHSGVVAAQTDDEFTASSVSHESALLIGNQLLEEQRYADAAQVFDEAIVALRVEQGSAALGTARLLLPAANAYAMLGRTRRANDYFSEAIEILGQSLSEDRAELIAQAFSVRDSNAFGMDMRDRIEDLEVVYGLATEALGPRDLRIVRMATTLGFLYANQGQPVVATEHLDHAHEVLTSIEDAGPDEIGQELLDLGSAYLGVNLLDTGNEIFRTAMSIGTSTQEPMTLVRYAPKYPTTCLNKQIQGEVWVEFTVDTEGRVRDPRVADIETWRGSKRRHAASNKKCLARMSEAAIAVVSKFAYIPKLEKGVPVVVQDFGVMISFYIQGQSAE